MPNISLIACVQNNNHGIGYENDLLHNIPEDMKRFRELTKGHPVIMGRKTWDSLPKKPLPARTNIILTSDPGIIVNYNFEVKPPYTVSFVKNISNAMGHALRAPGADEVFVIGGEKVYEDFLPFANKLYLTFVDGNKDADAFFPDVEFSQWKAMHCQAGRVDDLEYTFMDYSRD